MNEILDMLNKYLKDKKAVNSEIIKNILEKITALNFNEMVENLSEMLHKLGILMEINGGIENLSDVLATNFTLFIQKLLQDEEIKYELNLTPNMTFNLSIGKRAMGVEIKDGTINFRAEPFKWPDEPLDFFVEIPLDIIPKIFTGKENLMVELMAGERIKLWREKLPYNAGKLFELMPLLSITLEKLNLDKWL
ncbi:MAG: hypothetical protein ACFFDN_39165 [Candidatus Hodarchaeota archaeon]